MAMQFSGDSLQVPIREYQRDTDLASVSLVGMVHWADQKFYDEVNRYVTYREEGGSSVHYEFVAADVAEIEDAAKDGEYATLAKMLCLGFGSPLTKNIFTGLGLVPQLEHVKPKPHWQRHDTTLVGLASNLDGRAALFPTVGGFIGGVSMKLQKYRGGDVRSKVINGLNRSLRVAEGIEEKSTFIDLLDGNYEDAIIKDRNGIAIAAIQNHLNPPTGDGLTLLWGAAHLRGIGAGLLEMGFELVREMPVTAISSTPKEARYKS